MKDWLKDLYTRFLLWTNTKWSAWALFICAFADASFLPLPTPMFFLTLALLNITKTYKYALFGTLGTLTGAIAGYSIGHFAWLTINGEFTVLAQFVFNNIPGFSETAYNNIQIQYEKWDFGVLLLASLLPVPYKIFSISSGVFDLNLVMFSVATLLSQGAKFYLMALLVIKIGPAVRELLKFRFKVYALGFTVVLIGSFVLIKYLI